MIRLLITKEMKQPRAAYSIKSLSLARLDLAMPAMQRLLCNPQSLKAFADHKSEFIRLKNRESDLQSLAITKDNTTSHTEEAFNERKRVR